MLVQSVSVFSLAVFLWALMPEIKWMMMMINCYEQLPIPLLDELCCTTALFIKNCLEAAVFVGFPKNKCNFLHKKQACYRTAGPISHRAARCEEFFSCGGRHHCSIMEVGAYIWRSCTTIWRRSDVKFREYARGQKDRQTRTPHYSATPIIGGE